MDVENEKVSCVQILDIFTLFLSIEFLIGLEKLLWLKLKFTVNEKFLQRMFVEKSMFTIYFHLIYNLTD